jgi:hypothetical protein
MNHEKKIGATTWSRIIGMFTALQIGAYRDMEAAILDYVGFLARARLNSPCDDASCLLDAHFSTHSGIAAVARIKALTGLDALLTAARATMQNYGAFLNTANAHWQAQAARIQAVRIWGSIFVGTPLYALARIGGVDRGLFVALLLLDFLVLVMFRPDILRWPRWARILGGALWLLIVAAQLYTFFHYRSVFRAWAGTVHPPF